MSKYLNQLDGHKTSVIFLYLSEIDAVYKEYLKDKLDKMDAINQILRLYNYLKGFLFGLDVNHLLKKFVSDNGYLCDYLSFKSNSSGSYKYSLVLCLDPNNFALKYNRIAKK